MKHLTKCQWNLVSICWLTTAVFHMCPVSLSASGNSVATQLSNLENTIVGSSSVDLPAEKRLKDLELKVFGRVQAGSMADRVSALEKYAGIKKSDYVPPLDSPFDKGTKTEKNAVEAETGLGRNTNKAARSEPGQSLQLELQEAVKLHHQGREIEAEQSLRTILDMDPKNADAFFSMGAIAEKRGDLQAALEFYTLAMQANPGDSEAREAVSDLSSKVSAANKVVFFNPLACPPQPPVTLLQGRALAVGGTAGAANNNFAVQAGKMGLPPIPTLGAKQANPRSSFARTLARGALEAALSGTGLHCPLCALLRGF